MPFRAMSEILEPELLVLKSEPMSEVGLHDGAGAGWEGAFDKLEASLVPSA
jgi:hypothetical protein